MSGKAVTFFDDVIKALSIEAESAEFADVSPENLKEFFDNNSGKDALQNPVIPNTVTQNSADLSSGHPSQNFSDSTAFQTDAAGTRQPAMPPQSVSETPAPDPGDFSSFDLRTLHSAAQICSLCALC